MDRAEALWSELGKPEWKLPVITNAIAAAEVAALERALDELAEMKRANTQIQPGKVRHSASMIRGIEIGQAVLRRHIAAARRAMSSPEKSNG